MPGNELEITRFLIQNRGKISLNHLGLIKDIGKPGHGKGRYIPLTSEGDADLVSSDSSRKKADIYINGSGVSLKQSGYTFSFNRLQRANIEEVFSLLHVSEVQSRLRIMDSEVARFHSSIGMLRDRPWRDFFNEADLKKSLKFLMMEGSPNVGSSDHPAEYILEVPPGRITKNRIQVYTFDEYFQKYRDDFKVSIRRVWLGQNSKSEHGRARSLIRKPGNQPWVFDTISGTPNSGWMPNFPPEQRKTVYFLMLSKT